MNPVLSKPRYFSFDSDEPSIGGGDFSFEVEGAGDGDTIPMDGSSTQAVHAGEREHQESSAITTPIYQTSTYWFRESKELIAYQEGRSRRDEYGRYGNPTWRAVERKLNHLEGAESTVLFASGMCAAVTVFLTLVSKGSHLILTSDCYRRTRQFVRDHLSKLDVEATVIDPSDPEAFEAAIRDNTAFFFTESPTNPYLRVIDLEKIVRIARRRGVKVIVDATFASPVNYRPLDHGADLVLQSATKYMSGHNDLLAGTVSGSAETMEPIRQSAGVFGGVLGSHSAWLLLRGLKTLSLRIQRHNENGLIIARYLERHPRVRRVWYPGLESHPDHAVAIRDMNGFGGVVTFELDSNLEGAMRFVDATRLAYQAPSLGGVETLIELPVTMSYWTVPRAERMRLGITDSLVRLACGIEDHHDIIADLDRALSVL
ncbi:MAG: aminotransferase class I/II-fold pyridoxal phosphate-dependent enzyme [Proteobacteria bacterium]|nr:aminotransferase class I/II-fold pyridoxal phosphate-dependent enzyme [Pseudomonadota bacterium]